jgi:uncharacterized protein (DUF2336 family)
VSAVAMPVSQHARPDLQGLLSLANSRSLDDRQRLLLGIATLCDATPAGAEVSPVLAEIFLTLARQAEREIRQVLAHRLATAEWAPRALINMLALDEIEIARPIIAASPLLRDQDLLRILVEATLEHQIEVARRPYLSGAVADAIIDHGDPGPMTALAGNRTAEIGEEGMRRLIENARRIAGLRAPLSRHPRLTEAMGRQLYRWVGEALQDAISERFRVDRDVVGAAVGAAVEKAAAWTSQTQPRGGPDEAERLEMERRLVGKLQAAGQLRAGFLVKALREGRLSLFEQALTTLSGFSHSQVRRAVRHAEAEPLFLACAAVGVDRAVFTAMLADVQKLTGGWPQGPLDPALAVASPEAAASAFRQLMAPPPAAVG